MPDDVNVLTEQIIGCANGVFGHLGPGLPQNAHEEAICTELRNAGIRYRRQVPVPITYREEALGEYRIDMLLEDRVVVEIESIEQMAQVHEAELLTYLTANGKKAGLPINFDSQFLRDGIQEFVLESADFSVCSHAHA